MQRNARGISSEDLCSEENHDEGLDHMGIRMQLQRSFANNSSAAPVGCAGQDEGGCMAQKRVWLAAVFGRDLMLRARRKPRLRERTLCAGFTAGAATSSLILGGLPLGFFISGAGIGGGLEQALF